MNFQKIWHDPVGSNVLAGIILAALGFMYNKVTDIYPNMSIPWISKSLWYIIGAILIILAFLIFKRKQKRIGVLIQKYDNNEMFNNLMMDGNINGSYYSRNCHHYDFKQLLENLQKDFIIKFSEEEIPELTSFGKKFIKRVRT